MPNENEKIVRFEKAIFAEIDDKAAAILAEAEARQKEMLQKAQDEISTEMEKKTKSELEEIEAQYAQMITKEKLSTKQSVLLRRKELVEELFAKAGERLKAFADSAAYEDYLSGILGKVAGDGWTVLGRPADCALLQKLAPQCQVKEDPNNLLGGIVMICVDENRYVDETFAHKLQAQKENFYAESNIQLEAF